MSIIPFRTTALWIALATVQSVAAQEALLLHGRDILEIPHHYDARAGTVAASSTDDFRSRTPILQKAFRRNLRTDSNERYRRHVMLYSSGQRLDYFPVSEERRVPLPSNNARETADFIDAEAWEFNWPFAAFCLGITFVLLRGGASYRARHELLVRAHVTSVTDVVDRHKAERHTVRWAEPDSLASPIARSRASTRQRG